MKPLTFDQGRFRAGKLIAGVSHNGRYAGEQTQPSRRPVLVGLLDTARSLSRLFAQMEPTFRDHSAGLAPLLFFGRPDRHPELPNSIAVIEAQPEGVDLKVAGKLDQRELVRVGLGLCDTVLASSGKVDHELRPETVFVAGEVGARRYAGATPRAFRLLGNDGYASAFSFEAYDAPDGGDAGPAALIYAAALVLWFAATGTHAFGLQTDSNRYHDRREPFTGPPELGRLLEAVLVADRRARMSASELRDGLAALARAWGVDEPPFPPPGLEPSG